MSLKNGSAGTLNQYAGRSTTVICGQPCWRVVPSPRVDKAPARRPGVGKVTAVNQEARALRNPPNARVRSSLVGIAQPELHDLLPKIARCRPCAVEYYVGTDRHRHAGLVSPVP